MEVVWFWQRDSCGGALPDYFSLPRSIGGTLLATNASNDMTFIRLNSIPPGVGLAGWSTQTGAGAWGIHHPCGNEKRATFFTAVGLCPFDCACGDPSDYDYYDVETNGGWVEPHSSGSGIFNTNNQLTGQLFGTCCACSDPHDCDHVDAFTYMYGEFQTTYEHVRTWLEIGGTINVDRAFIGTEEGTPTRPFNTVPEAHNFAWNGSRIRIRAGSYLLPVVLNKRVEVLASDGVVRIGG